MAIILNPSSNNGEISDSSDDGEDEMVVIEESQRAHNSPPRKKRKLSNGLSQIQQSPSTDNQSSSDSDQEEKTSDKENNHNSRNIKKNPRKRPRSALSQVSKSKNNKRIRNGRHQNEVVHQFGNIRLKEAIEISPGAIVRLELINFLCHSNFSIAFHPFVNVISGQNGSGKSAIEAAISMALGINAKKTGRGNNIKDVIKFGKDFAVIRLFLHNKGSERLTEPDYGDEIVIERRLTKNNKNGTSQFKVLNSKLKKVGAGVKAVRQIVDRLNINVDNPCVVLKQSTAKEFLNSTKSADKFKFFMQASKLSDYAKSLDEAKRNVVEARERQKQTKGSFSQIKDRYFQCKQQYEALVQTEKQQRMMEQWKVSEKWMIYHEEAGAVKKHEVRVRSALNKINKGNETLTRLKEELKNKMEIATKAKNELQEKQTESDKYTLPINELKEKMRKLDGERKNMARSANSKMKFIDKSRRKIRDYQKQYNQCAQQLENDERGRKLASLQRQINDSTEKLNQYRKQREPLQQKCEKTIEMKDNEDKLNQRANDKQSKQNQVNGYQRQLQQFNRENDRSEFFLDPQIKWNKSVTVRAIRAELSRYQRKFSRPPIGPLGEYIKMIPDTDQNKMHRHIQIVQGVLKNTLYSFLVSTRADLELFKRIMRSKFRYIPPALQWDYTDRPFQIEANIFDGYRTRDVDGPIIRITDMFTIKDNNPWVYNAIITNSNPERIYAHGTLNAAKRLLQTIDQHKLKRIAHIMTYREQKLYIVKRKGSTVSGNPIKDSRPILQRDQSQLKAWVQQELNKAINELRSIDQSIHELRRFVQQSNQETMGYQRQLQTLNRNIRNQESRLQSLQRQQREIQEDEDDNDEIQQTMTELNNSIEDEKAEIQGLEEEIEPFKNKEKEILEAIRVCKRELHDLEQKIKKEQHSIHMLKNRYHTMCDELKNKQKAIKLIPVRIGQYEDEHDSAKKELEKEKKRINAICVEAKQAGPEVLPEHYPRNPRNRNRVFQLHELQRERMRTEARLEEWRKSAPPAEEIKERFDKIKPQYETHQQRVDSVNQHVDEMNRMLRHRTKEWQQMKDHVKRRLSIEFRIIMRKQGHEGGLDIDYEAKKLDMRVHMASHDGSTQVVNSKTLSGGERSFTQVALIMALQKFSGSPMCIYDEFDVFMDSVNRGNSIKILLGAALGDDKEKPSPPERQYIFITPNDISPMIASGHTKNYISIHKLNPPRK